MTVRLVTVLMVDDDDDRSIDGLWFVNMIDGSWLLDGDDGWLMGWLVMTNDSRHTYW